MKKLITLLLTLMIIAYSSVSVFAMPFNRTEKGTITITVVSDSVNVNNIEYRLYKIADFYANKYEFLLNGDFSESGISLNFDKNTTDEEIKNKIDTLNGFIINNNITPNYVGYTNDGELIFDDLSNGLYFLTGPISYIYEGEDYYSYKPQSTFVAVPSVVDGEYKFDVEVVNKYTKDFTGTDDDSPFTELSVVKKFNDAGYENDRPSEIIVDLLKNNVLFDTVTLNESNNFSHKWKYLERKDGDTNNVWKVEERVPDNYQDSYDYEGRKVTITNTRVTPPNTPDPELPNTGVLWWPVPILLTVGIASMVIGHMRNKNEA